MLQELHVTNFALIDKLHLTFSDGLNILTGETGAGKSIIIDALGLTLGERASGGDLVRVGAERAIVEAVFDLTQSPDGLREKFVEAGYLSEDENETLFITRELTRHGGKSQCRVNGRLVPVSVLKEIGDSLVDVHGQHDHQSLLDAEKHIDIFDNWCGPDVLALRASISERSSASNTLKRELEQLRSDTRERARMLDLYRFQQEEIAVSNIRPGEEGELAAERLRLANSEKLSTTASEAYAALSGVERTSGALDILNRALATVEHAVVLDESLQPVAEALLSAVSYMEDAAGQLRHYQDTIEFNPERLEEIENRLDLFRNLKRKYGNTLEEIIKYGEDLTDNLTKLENSEARENELATAITKADAELVKIAGRLTDLREKRRAVFAEKIKQELVDLGMQATRFEVSIIPQTINSRGGDRLEFLLSANPGEPLRPLAKIASGGEMSRIMLAIKSVLARTGAIPTMIFDEIDVGVGGRTAQVIADKLHALAQSAQILCITHLAQIASRAGTHFLIEKLIEADRTIVHVSELDSEERVEEIARMLGGSRRTDAVVQHAREMLSASH